MRHPWKGRTVPEENILLNPRPFKKPQGKLHGRSEEGRLQSLLNLLQNERNKAKTDAEREAIDGLAFTCQKKLNAIMEEKRNEEANGDSIDSCDPGDPDVCNGG